MELNRRYYEVAHRINPIKVPDSGEYECIYNKSSGYSFTIFSEKNEYYS